MKVGSLFSGVGGIDLALERAGMEIKWQVEKDPYCQKVLKKHWPDTELILSVEDFLASLSALQASEKEPTMTDGSGPISLDAFAFLDRIGCWRKTSLGFCQLTLDGSLEEFSETWPRSGTMRNGIVYQQQPLGPRTLDSESFLWPTPMAGARGLYMGKDGDRDRSRLEETVARLEGKTRGQLNPTWVEWLMGFPIGWTDLDLKHLEMQSSRK